MTGVRALRIAVADLNGQARGKRLPASRRDKLETGGARMPLSALNVDIRGDDIEGSPLVFATGDRDGVLHPTERGTVPVPWLETATELIPMWMFTEDGAPFAGDPRHALAAVLARYGARGWTPVVATELEFYLVDDSGDELRPPPSPRSGKRRLGGEILSLRALDAFDGFFSALYDGCDAMGIPAETAISESGLGQFEMNLVHGPAMRAADDAWLFKLLVRGLARRHGFAATFMAKPYPDHAGSGLHMHFSLLDSEGRNLFDDGAEKGSHILRHAVAGCLAAMRPSTLVFAPHGPSYDRLVPEAHAPTAIGWAYENRTVALRIPAGPPGARRIEHRVAGGDINPYLMLAAVLGAALDGIEAGLEPPPPVTGNAYGLNLEALPADWDTAIDLFAEDPAIARIFQHELIRNFVMTKRQERAIWDGLGPHERIDLYLDTV